MRELNEIRIACDVPARLYVVFTLIAGLCGAFVTAWWVAHRARQRKKRGRSWSKAVRGLVVLHLPFYDHLAYRNLFIAPCRAYILAGPNDLASTTGTWADYSVSSAFLPDVAYGTLGLRLRTIFTFSTPLVPSPHDDENHFHINNDERDFTCTANSPTPDNFNMQTKCQQVISPIHVVVAARSCTCSCRPIFDFHSLPEIRNSTTKRCEESCPVETLTNWKKQDIANGTFGY